MVRGLHSCKKENTPYVGDVKTFIIEERIGRSGTPWTKIRSAPANQGGRPYEVMSVTATDYTDAHGNISFNLELEPQNGSGTTQEPAQRAFTGGSAQSSGAMSKDDYWARKEERDIEASRRMNRSHAQEMAIRYFALQGGYPEGKTPAEALSEMTDHFQRDSWKTAQESKEDVI